MFKNDEKASKNFGLFIDVIAIVIAYWGAFQGFLPLLGEESEIIVNYYLINFIPAIWLTWFICTKNSVYNGKVSWLAFIPIGFTLLFWLAGAVPLFENEELILQLVLYLIIFLADGVWELLKPTKVGTKASIIVSIVLFGLTLDLYNGLYSKLAGVLDIFDSINPFQFHKYALYALLVFFILHLLLSIANNVCDIKSTVAKNTEILAENNKVEPGQEASEDVLPSDEN